MRRRGVGGLMRWSLVTGLALLALVLLGALEPAFAAADPLDANWVLMNDQDQLANRFGTSDTVLVTGSAVGGVGLIPAVDIYVVKNADWNARDGEPLADVSNPEHIPNTAVGFEVVDLPIWIPHLRVGAYDVVIDRDENGQYDAGVDQVVGGGPDPGFTVFFDGNRRVIDKQALKEQYAGPWKQVANDAKILSSMVAAFQIVDQVSGVAHLAEAGFRLWEGPSSLAVLPCDNSACGKAAHAFDIVAGNLEPGSVAWNGTAAHVCASLIQDPLDKHYCKSPFDDPAGYLSMADFGASQLNIASQNLDRAVAGIYADPPDPHYDQVWPYAPPVTHFSPASALSPDPEEATLANRLDDAAGRSLALLHGLERFDGAAQDGDDVAGGRQARAIADNADGLADLLLGVRDDAATLAAAMRASGIEGSIAAMRPELEALQQRLAAQGLSDAERAAFHAEGWTDDELAELVSELLATPIADVPDDLPTVLDAIPAKVHDALPALTDIANAADAIGVTAPSSQPPTPAFTSSVPDAGHPRAIAFDASGSSDPDGTVAGYAWDFGDGTTGTGVSPTHAYAHAGSYMVKLVVTDDSGTSGEVTTPVGVQSAAPVATFVATPETGPAPINIAFDAAGSADPDGTIASYIWNFGDGATDGGVNPQHTYAFAGSYTVTLTVVDDDGVLATFARSLTLGGANQPPTAAFTATPLAGTASLQVTVDGASSSDADGPIADWAWDFGDGASGHGVTATHQYADPGTYTITLTVTDADGGTGTATAPIEVRANAAPQPTDDNLSAVVVGALDVLSNDADPDGDPMTVSGHTPAEHGDVDCSPEGACRYSARLGYVGADGFDYTVQDSGGRSATAHVTVDVQRPDEPPSRLTARDDDLAVPYGHAGTAHVLANDDGGAPLTVTATGDAAHGTAICSEHGDCAYDPADGYSGSDAFTYTSHDGEGGEARATVHVIVAPRDAGAVVTASGRATDGADLHAGHDATWRAGSRATPDGVSGQELEALPMPTIGVTFDGDHALRAGSVTTAVGWTATTTSGDGVKAAAGHDALLGEAISVPIPRPLPPINQGTGGDGHVPILVGSKVFAFFHHSYPTSVTCVDRRTGLLCPGYPKPLRVSAGPIIGPAAVVGRRIYVHAFATPSGYAQSAPVALYCWDAASDRSCGMIIAGRRSGTTDPGASAPRLVDGRIYLAATGGELLCVDPATERACPGAPLRTGLSGLPDGSQSGYRDGYDIVAHGTRVFVAGQEDGRVACLDVAAKKRCPGWDAPRSLDGNWNLVNEHDADGAVVGVCAVRAGSGRCVRDDDSEHEEDLTDWPSTEGFYSITEEAETGTRTLLPSLSDAGLACWDWTTRAPCAGGTYSGGRIFTDANGDILPSAYGAVWDGSCVVALGDPGLVFTVDPRGYAPCTSLNAGTESQTVDLRDQRCDRTVGGGRWVSAGLTDGGDALHELAGVVVTVRDATTHAVLAQGDVLAGGALNLQDVDPDAHPAVTIEAVATSADGGKAWDDGVPPRIRLTWHADPAQLCLRTTTPATCDDGPGPAPVGITAHGDDPADVAKATLNLLPGACDHAPKVETPAAAELDEQTPLDARVRATDPDGDSLSYALTDPPPGASIDARTGVVSWAPSEDQGPGHYAIEVLVTEDRDPAKRATTRLDVTVREVNRPPVLQALASPVLAIGRPLALSAFATDPDVPANHITYTLSAAPSGAQIDSGTGAIAWTPAAAGVASFGVRATDDGAPALSGDGAFSVTSPGPVSAASNGAELLLRCAKRDVVLEDVIPRAHDVQLLGVADRRFVGHRVAIVFQATGRTVATPVVGSDGRFSAVARLPRRSLRSSNRARYQAGIGSDRSLSLKLTRRMQVTSVRAAGGRVVIKGRVVGPLASRAADRTIAVQQLVTCAKATTVGRVVPRADGTFTATFASPVGQHASVYRLMTRVRRTIAERTLHTTYTLPRAVDF